jgi:hypothetical protein
MPMTMIPIGSKFFTQPHVKHSQAEERDGKEDEQHVLHMDTNSGINSFSY